MMALTESVPAVSHVGLPPRAAQPSLFSLHEELDRERREHSKLQQAVFEAAQIQRVLCAPRELISGGYEIAGEIFPVRHLSGDFFKVMELDDGLLGIALGDIAGKGLTAGIWLTHLLSLVQRAARNFSNPACAVAEVNRELCKEQSEPPLTALFLAILDPRTGEVAYTNAGLPAPLFLRANRTAVERLDLGGPMLGAIENSAFDSGYLVMSPGDMLVAYSDGVTECRNPADEEFEMDRLSAAALAAHGRSANPALFSMLGTVLDFAGSNRPGDDLTLLVVRRRLETPEASGRHEQDYSEPLPKAATVPRPKKTGPRGRGTK